MSTILVTGASRGIGAYLCRRLRDSGHRVFAGMRDPGAVRDRDSPNDREGVEGIRLDVRIDQDVSNALSHIESSVGRLDVLINNAGVAWLAPVELQSDDVLRQTMETNFFGALRMTRAVLPAMRRNRSGKIINISSLAAFHGLPAEAAYCASKSALDIASQSLALEVERFGVSVTSIRPGYTVGGLASSDIAEDVARDSEYEPMLRHLEGLYAQSAEAAESPELVASAVMEILATNTPPPCVEIGELASAVAVVRQGDPSERLDSMRAVNALEWWRAGRDRPTTENAR